MQPVYKEPNKIEEVMVLEKMFDNKPESDASFARVPLAGDGNCRDNLSNQKTVNP